MNSDKKIRISVLEDLMDKIEVCLCVFYEQNVITYRNTLKVKKDIILVRAFKKTLLKTCILLIRNICFTATFIVTIWSYKIRRIIQTI